MSIGRLITLFIFLILLNNCATTKEIIEKTVGRASCDLRKPGMFQVKNTSETMKEHNCTYGLKMKLRIIDSSLIPSMVQGGDDLCHRVTYALCPSAPAETYAAKIDRSIIFKGKIVTTYSSNKELKPGTWDIDVKIPVPKDAQAGVYAVRTNIIVGNNYYSKVVEFQVLINK